jgi:uncharacterized protein (TIGR00661 family)
MKILYAIQGTGNGHLSRALEIIPFLQKKAELDILISGCQVDLTLPYPVKYKFNGFGFIFGKKGGVDVLGTYFQMKTRRLASEIKSLPVEEYDLIINDFEPVSAWAAYFKNKPCIALSNQSALLSPGAPRPNHRDLVGEMVIKYYAPATAHYGFHFAKFAKDIFTPIIRKEVRDLRPTNKGHYTVYLPSYDDERIIKNLSKIKNVKWEVFSKHNKREIIFENGFIKPISNVSFVKSMASREGVLCGAGFGTAAEALFLKKKLLVIPMKNQYEQHCNAAALAKLGVPSMKSLKGKHLRHIEEWIQSGKIAEVDYPDNTEQLVDLILENHCKAEVKETPYSWNKNIVQRLIR